MNSPETKPAYRLVPVVITPAIQDALTRWTDMPRAAWRDVIDALERVEYLSGQQAPNQSAELEYPARGGVDYLMDAVQHYADTKDESTKERIHQMLLRDAIKFRDLAAVPEQQQASTVPAGWKLVPIVPTDAMAAAAIKVGLRTPAVNGVASYCAMLAAAPQPPVALAHALTDAEREAARNALSAELGQAMDCTRVWSAWGVGTMSEDDFQLLADNDERLDAILDAVFAAAHLARKG